MFDINTLIKNATLSHDKVALNAYKNIKSEFEKFKYAQKLPRNIDEQTQFRIISNYSKKLKDSIKQFSEARRDDLVSEYTNELEVVKKLLPEPVNASDINLFIQDDEEFFSKYLVSEFTGNEDETVMVHKIPKKDMGKAIKYLKSKFPTADGKMISEIVKKYIV